MYLVDKVVLELSLFTKVYLFWLVSFMVEACICTFETTCIDTNVGSSFEHKNNKFNKINDIIYEKLSIEILWK